MTFSHDCFSMIVTARDRTTRIHTHTQNLIFLRKFLGFLEVKINQGQIFCLPSRIPHSPQRPEARSSDLFTWDDSSIDPEKPVINLIPKSGQEGSLGLVVERRREGKEEIDGLIFYEDFNTCNAAEAW